jgi:hypothetical protein
MKPSHWLASILAAAVFSPTAGAHAQDRAPTPTASNALTPRPDAPTTETERAADEERRANLDAAALKSDGRASFPLLGEDHPLQIEPHTSIISQYVFSLREEAGSSDWFHEFELPRAFAWVDARYDDAEARVLIEGVRSASEGALIGVAGDSLVLRLREAWASHTAWGLLETRIGLVPTMTVGPIEAMWGMRPIQPTGIERTALASPADLGVTLRAVLPNRHGWVGVAGYNGEGYARRELNRGKNIELAANLHPLAGVRGVEPLTVFASYVSGSSGTGLGRADRWTAALGWQGERIRGGVTTTYALGVAGAPEVDSLVVEGFVRIMPLERLVLGADVLHWQRDLSVGGDTAISVSGAAGYFIVDPVAAFIAVDGQVFGDAARASLPGQDDLRIRWIGTASF